MNPSLVNNPELWTESRQNPFLPDTNAPASHNTTVPTTQDLPAVGQHSERISNAFPGSSDRPLEFEKLGAKEDSQIIAEMPESSSTNQQAGTGQKALAPTPEDLAHAYAIGGVPKSNTQVNERVKAREEQIKQDWDYLESLPTDRARINARDRGIGPRLPEEAMTMYPPSHADIEYARETKARMSKEHEKRENLAKENEEKAKKEREEEEAGKSLC